MSLESVEWHDSLTSCHPYPLFTATITPHLTSLGGISSVFFICMKFVATSGAIIMRERRVCVFDKLAYERSSVCLHLSCGVCAYIWVTVCVDHKCELPSVCVFGWVCVAQPRVEEHEIHQHVSAVGVLRHEAAWLREFCLRSRLCWRDQSQSNRCRNKEQVAARKLTVQLLSVETSKEETEKRGGMQALWRHVEKECIGIQRQRATHAGWCPWCDFSLTVIKCTGT